VGGQLDKDFLPTLVTRSCRRERTDLCPSGKRDAQVVEVSQVRLLEEPAC